jgi:uncharacterized protein (TIGR03382 family)
MLAVAGLSVAANGQGVMKFLCSVNGGPFQANVTANPGDHVDVLVTCSYTGTGTSVPVGFGSANFQPIVSNWTLADSVSTGASTSGNVQGGMINPQTGVGNNAYATPSTGWSLATDSNGDPAPLSASLQVPAAPYASGTYGRVFPMGRTALSGANAITSFVHVNPPADQLGRTYAPGTYLRIAQANVPNWFNSTDNYSGGSGLNVAQLYVTNRTTSDPDFWGNQNVNFDGPSGAFVNSTRVAAQDARRVDVQLYRFGITLSNDGTARTLTIDAPVAGQQEVSTTLGPTSTNRYFGYYSAVSQNNPNATFAHFDNSSASVQTGSISIVPTPASLALLGLGGLVIGRRRRA